MDLGSILFILALMVLVGLIIGRPFFEKDQKSPQAEFDALDHQQSTLLAERDRILNAIQELDFDHALGKVPENEYPSQRTILMQKGAEVLRQLDALEELEAEGDADARLEAALSVRRMETATAGVVADGVGEGLPSASGDGSGEGKLRYSSTFDPDDELEVLLANRRRARQEKSAGFCHKCGGALKKSDRFCPKCGASLNA